MKIRFYLLIMLIVPILMHCTKEETEKTYNFSVLGIEEINVDGVVITTEESGFPVKDEAFVVTGFTYGGATNEYDLVIVGDYPDNQDIIVKKKYDNVAVLIESDAESKYKIITVSRTGYCEKIVYTIGFL